MTRAGAGLTKPVVPRAARVVTSRFKVKVVRVTLAPAGSSTLAPGRIETAADAVRLLPAIHARLGCPADQECFVVLGLDARNGLVAIALAGVGILTAALVHPREVFAPMLRAGGVAAVIVTHNHPSGDVSPSSEDVDLTSRLVQAGRILGIPVIDSLVTAGSMFRSIQLGLAEEVS